MIRATAVVSLALLLAGYAPAEDEPLQPDTLMNWLRIIELSDTKLLYAGDVNEYYFAVKIDKEGDLLFCKHEHGPQPERNPREFATKVLAEDGSPLESAAPFKQPPKSIELTYRSSSKFGPLATSSSVSIAYSRGVFLQLPKHKEKFVVVRFQEIVDGKPVTLLEQRIQMPSKSAR